MKIKKKSREDYEYSDLFLFIREEHLRGGQLYKKVDHKIVLDMELSKNDLAVYMAILKYCSYKDFYQRIVNDLIFKACGIRQENQVRHIKKLESKGYIDVRHNGSNNSYKIEVNPLEYLPIKLNQFDGLAEDRTGYVRRLRGLILSNGNNRIPNFKTAVKKCGGILDRREYNAMRRQYNFVIDTDNYNQTDVANYVLLDF